MILSRWQLVVTPTPHLHPRGKTTGTVALLLIPLQQKPLRWQARRLPYKPFT